MTKIKSTDTGLGGMQYPFLSGDWEIITTPIDDQDGIRELPRTGDFLRLVRQDRVVDIYNPEPLPLEMSLRKGGFVLSKRLSRVMRPYYFWGMFSEVNIRYDSNLDKKTWDGAGLISRRFLGKLTRNLPEAKKDMLRRRLRRTGRVEFTVLSEHGQDKGHALVVDDLDADMVLPCDTKTELKLTNGKTFVGVNPVRHKNTPLWIDVQSCINLYPFIRNEHYTQWLRRYGDEHLKRIEQGGFDNAFRDNAEKWWLAEYLASGGKAMWFGGVVRGLARLFTKKVEQRSVKKNKFPAPGGRFYVFVDSIGNREVPKGHIELDKRNATAWVSNKDWTEIASVLGGADQDDSLLCLPFHDYDGDLKIIVWRNPNQPGEYVILRPTDSTADLFDEWIELDSRELTTRIDQRSHTYECEIPGMAITNAPYSVAAMWPTVQAARRNLGMPGAYINLMMVLQAVEGDLPTVLPARTEDVIDAVAKTGANTGAIKTWLQKFARAHYPKHPLVPKPLIPRVKNFLPEEDRNIFIPDNNHWFSRLIAEVGIELDIFNAKRDMIIQKTMPPIQVFKYGNGFIQQAARVRTAYTDVFRMLDHDPEDEDFLDAWKATEAALSKYPEKDWERILAAIISRVYLYGAAIGSDSVVWQKQLTSKMLEMLRAANVIAEPNFIAVEEHRLSVTVGVPVRVNGAWFAYQIAVCEQQNRPVPAQMRDVPKAQRDRMKGQVQAWAERGLFDGQVFEVQKQDNRKVVLKNGRLLGYIQHGQEERVADTFVGGYATSDDGNLLLVSAT